MLDVLDFIENALVHFNVFDALDLVERARFTRFRVLSPDGSIDLLLVQVLPIHVLPIDVLLVHVLPVHVLLVRVLPIHVLLVYVLPVHVSTSSRFTNPCFTSPRFTSPRFC